MKVFCKFCTKNKNGFCVAKKNANVEESKARKCLKYAEDTTLKIQWEEYHENNKKAIPTYKPTFRYYEKLTGNKTEEIEPGPLFVKIN